MITPLTDNIKRSYYDVQLVAGALTVAVTAVALYIILNQSIHLAMPGIVVGCVCLSTFTIATLLRCVRHHKQVPVAQPSPQLEPEPLSVTPASLPQPAQDHHLYGETSDVSLESGNPPSVENASRNSLVPENPLSDSSQTETQPPLPLPIDTSSSTLAIPPSPTTPKVQLTGEQFKAIVVKPLIEALDRVIKAFVKADYRLCQKQELPKDKETELATSIQKLNAFALAALDDPAFVVQDLLRHYLGEVKVSIARRRLIMAANFGDEKQQKAALALWHKAHETNDLAPFRALCGRVRNGQEAAFVKQLPPLLMKCYDIDEPGLQKWADQLIVKVCNVELTNELKAQVLTVAGKVGLDDKQFRTALQQLLSALIAQYMKTQRGDAEAFVRMAFIDLINGSLKSRLQYILGIVARNVALFPILFEDDQDKVFPALDKAFLLSESGEYIADEKEGVEQLLDEQLKLNARLKHKIALLRVRGEFYKEVVTACSQGVSDSEKMKYQSESQAYQLPQGTMAVPCSLNAHPLKEVKKYGDNWMIKQVAKAGNALLPEWAVKSLIGKLMGSIEEFLPPTKTSEGSVVDAIKGIVLRALYPILNGAILDKPFKAPFRAIIGTHATQKNASDSPRIAERMKELSRAEDLTWEQRWYTKRALVPSD